MIQYTSINDAWGINNNKKELFTSSPEKENKPLKKSVEKVECNILEHVANCQECKNKLRELFTVENKTIEYKIIKNAPIEPFYETFMNRLNENRELSIFILIVLIVIISVLLIHSYRKPVPVVSDRKGFYIFPEDLEKFRTLLELKTL